MKIGICYGHVASNIGDLAINQGVAGMLHRIAPDAEVHVVLRDPNEAHLDRAKAAFAEVPNLSFGVLHTGKTQSGGAAGDHARLAKAMQYVLEPARFIDDAGLAGCDVVLGNSGELLFAYEDGANHIDLVWNMLPVLAAKSAGMGYITLPSTFGPFEARALNPMVQAFFGLNDAVALREPRSSTFVEQFLDARPPALLDPAFFLSGLQPTGRDDEGILGLSMRLEDFGLRVGAGRSAGVMERYRKQGFGDSRSFAFSVAAARSFLDRAGGRVHVIVASRSADHELAQAVAQTLGEQGHGERVHVVQPASVSEYCEALGKTSFIVASRFHACILGLLAGRPVMGVYFDQHGHKMPGLFDLFGIPDYCRNLSRTSPEAVADEVVPLFLMREQAFAGMADRLPALQQETLEWLQQAMAGTSRRRPEGVTAASLAYARGIEAIRRVCAMDVRWEARRLEPEPVGGEITGEEVRASLSFQLGNMLVRAVLMPGRNTIVGPYQLVQLVRAGRMLRAGKLGDWLKLEEKYGENAYFRLNAPVVRSKYRLLQQGFRPGAVSVPQGYQRRDDTVFYLLHNSLPYATGGYAIRTHGLLRGLSADGWQVFGVTRPGFPLDVKSRRGLYVPRVSASRAIPDTDAIDEVSYLRLPQSQSHSSDTPPDTDLYIQAYVERLLTLCSKHNPGVIHAASFFWNGIAAVNVARMLGLPSIYSVRGLWDLVRADPFSGGRHSDEYRMRVRMETEACLQATAVIAITEALKQVLIKRGVPGDKILVVPNGVDTDRFVPMPRDSELEGRLGYAGKKVIGYIGAFAPYEGLEYLLQAAAKLSRHRDDFRVLMVGDGIKYEELQTLRDRLHLGDVVTVTGRVPHDEIKRYYSLVDIVPLPRRGLPVCEIVSPLKPFEAMSMGKTVVASDVAALAEIVDDGNTGLLHRKDDAQDLARTLEILLDNPELTQRLGEAARKWVVANRDWRILSKTVGDLYRDLLGRRPT